MYLFLSTLSFMWFVKENQFVLALWMAPLEYGIQEPVKVVLLEVST